MVTVCARFVNRDGQKGFSRRREDAGLNGQVEDVYQKIEISLPPSQKAAGGNDSGPECWPVLFLPTAGHVFRKSATV